MTRNYASAIAALNTLQSNYATVDAIRKSGRDANALAIPEMIEWCRRIGYQPSDFDKLNIIHIAGTKGKGSTAAFVSSILTQYLGVKYTPPSIQTNDPKNKDGSNKSHHLNKIGLYTSPHLRFVRERFQFNGSPLSESLFTRYFYEVWDRLEASARTEGHEPQIKPAYFRYLTLMAFHTFLSEGVDGAIIECGIGGEYDSTNVVDKPVVCGITSLGIDHVSLLGGRIEEIAWHKAGIIKPGVPCLTVPQKPEAMAVITKRAEDAAPPAELKPVPIYSQIADSTVPLGLAGYFQHSNASLAVALSSAWLQAMSIKQTAPFFGAIPDKIKRGLRQVRWGGRCETRRDPQSEGITWHIDGGHTLESIEVVGTWFAEEVNRTIFPDTQKRVLVFNQQTRDANVLATALHRVLREKLDAPYRDPPITHAVFCTNTTFAQSGYRPDLVSINTNAEDVGEMKVQKELAETWKRADPRAEVAVVRTIEEAVEFVREFGREGEREEGVVGVDGVVVLVTGSLHLVGGLLEVLESGKGTGRASEDGE